MKLDLSSYRAARAAPNRRKRVALFLSATVVLSAAIGVVVSAKREAIREMIYFRLVAAGYQDNSEVRARDRLLAGPGNILRGLVERNPLPVLTLDVKFQHMENLRYRRDAALASGFLFQDSASFVPGRIRTDGRTLRVKLRLKGDLTDHLEDGRWAFRVEVKDDNQIMGMRRFSLHDPQGRDHHVEPIFNAALRSFGVLTPRYDFVRVILNGERLGIMAMEEHFSKELLESQGRREGVILKFDESGFWSQMAREGSPGYLHDFTRAELGPFQEARIERTPVLAAQRDLAIGLYRGLLYKGLKPHEVFDAETTGRFLAVVHAFGAWHALQWNNRRFYFNPVTARLEPIGFDAMAAHVGMLDEPFDAMLLADPVIRKAFEGALSDISARWGLENGLGSRLRAVEEAGLKALRLQYPLLVEGILDPVPSRAAAALTSSRRAAALSEASLDSVQTPDSSSYTGAELLKMSTLVVDGVLGLEVLNLAPSPVELSKVAAAPYDTTVAGAPGPVSCPTVGLGPTKLDPSPPGAPPRRRVFWLGRGDVGCAFRASARRVGDTRTVDVFSTRTVPPLQVHPLRSMAVADLVEASPFLRYDAGLGELRVTRGEWNVESTLIVPEGVKVVMEAGTHLRFAAAAALVLKGGMRLEGTAESPILFTGQQDSQPWPGLVAFNSDANAQVSWKHVRVENTAGMSRGGWGLTAGVVFHGGQVELADVVFEGNRAEDALNVISTEFDLTRITVRNALSDGLDIDFGTGRISDSWFEAIGSIGGGDAVDVSGATVEAEGISFAHIGDKALSVGEGAVVRARNLSVDDAGAGIVSKDHSWVRLDGAKIRNVWNTGLMAYTKKREFGGAVLEASGVSFENTPRTTQVQFGSVLRVNGTVIQQVAVNVDSLYATVMRPGLRN